MNEEAEEATRKKGRNARFAVQVVSRYKFTCAFTGLLLSNFDLGIPLDAREVQTGLDFSDRLPELFESKAMGEHALRVLDECLKLEKTILNDVRTELPHVREAVKWAGHLPK